MSKYVSKASKELTEQSNRLTPHEYAAAQRERERTLEIQNQVPTMVAQEWMRSKGVQGRLGTPEWREGRRALLEEMGIGRYLPHLRAA